MFLSIVVGTESTSASYFVAILIFFCRYMINLHYFKQISDMNLAMSEKYLNKNDRHEFDLFL